jgi:hypothetical protein
MGIDAKLLVGFLLVALIPIEFFALMAGSLHLAGVGQGVD